MSEISDMIGDGFADLQAVLDSPSFTFGAATIPCVVSTLEVGSTVEVGGILKAVTFKLLVAPGDITGTVPTCGKTVVYGGATYRIEHDRKTAAGSYEFLLGSPNR